jgi:phosphatidylinositol-3,4,5-trisphosphate 3-phosphatase/dual-specificity protein phosphatase PTEN
VCARQKLIFFSAMGFPASGLESAWRNHIDDVAKFLKTSHPNSFMIWNLSEREYDYGKFDNQLQDFGFPDHHSPPLDMLFKIILSMDNWLRAGKDNVAVVHW